jgi:Ca2+-binding EF-hand superfamily protein
MRTLTGVTLLAAAGLLALAPLGAAERPAAGDDDDVQDVLYWGTPHPVLLRLHLRSGGGPATARWDAFLAKLFAYLDRNRSGGLDRVETRRVPTPAQLAQLLQGNVMVQPSAGDAAVPFESLDADRDGKVTLEELKAYYKQNNLGPVGVSGAPAVSPALATRAARQAAVLPPAAPGDPLFALLDANKDGKLSRAELAASEKVLMRLDADDDEMVSEAEVGISRAGAVRPSRAVGVKGRGMAKPRPAAPSVLLLVPKDDSGRRATGKLALAREVLARYDVNKDGKLTPDEVGFPAEMFARLDRNTDGKLDVLELSRWLKGRPSGEFTVRLGPEPAMMRPAAMRARGAKADGATGVTLGSVRIDVISQPSPRYATAQYLLNVFEGADRDSKGYITRAQVAKSGFSFAFALADRNGDGRLTRQELRDYLALGKGAAGARVELSLVSTGQGLFQAMDADGDGRLSVREMRSAWDRLAEFDRDGDGCISQNELPQRFRLVVADGPSVPSPGVRDLAGGMGAPAAADAPGRGPVWFRKMDRNGDGDVSRAEWLGSKEDFDRIDTDGDGLISAAEAEAFDARLRK